ncbi:hypothetical protein Pcinc_039878 [Petrolisthes cinctipes]|uniref:PB1 domain-containing protein n=1 Tax=Petrolisthes cinctipes TaxID=88211 RepID=A0AAE1BQQ6_PETCI|nr:hypothetical protein Pcinc_039878 [Petrolisthes cinctipes]
MPMQTTSNNMATGEAAEIRVKIAYSGEVYITYVPPVTEVAALEEEIRAVCKFDSDQDFTIKWIDEEGDPISISHEYELGEALRLYDINKDSELTIHGVFLCLMSDRCNKMFCKGDGREEEREREGLEGRGKEEGGPGREREGRGGEKDGGKGGGGEKDEGKGGGRERRGRFAQV